MMEPGKYTSKQIIEYLKQAPYEEWVKVYNQLNEGEIKPENLNMSLLVMDYIKSSVEYTPELNEEFVKWKKEHLKEANLRLEEYLLKEAYKCKQECKNRNSNFNKIFSSLKRVFFHSR